MSHSPDYRNSPGERERGLLCNGSSDLSHDAVADPCLTNGLIRILKHGDTFAVFDHYGNIKPVAKGEEGVYHDGTRFVSCLLLDIDGACPFFLSSTVRDDNDQLTVALTNPDLRYPNVNHLPLGSLHIARRFFLWAGVCYQEVTVENHSRQRATTRLRIRCAADYADIFEIGGTARKGRGEELPPLVEASALVLSYRGLDRIERRTRFEFSPAAEISASGAIFELSLEPRQVARLYITARCELVGTAAPRRLKIDEARAQALDEIRSRKGNACAMYGSNGQFNAWINRALSDLHMMTTALPTGPYPYAGVPWFNTPFGRDGLITALECLWFWPELARGVLSYLAQHQATTTDPEQDAEPGKIVHEVRKGEMAALKEIPFGRYYGAVDGTPLFVLLAGAYYDRTGDLSFIKDIWPNIHAALRWIEQFGDRDGDGFVEYQRQSADGLFHQGWKDTDDAIFHEDGSEAIGPVALCEVQSYVYGAWQAAANLAEALGLHDQAVLPRKRAERLREEFNRVFWCEEISSFAFALDGRKRPCRVRASNAGQCLISGIATRDHARLVSQTLMAPRSFGGWGIRTVAEGEARYNPMAYHNGSVWPHDNALIVHGFGRYGFAKEVLAIFQGMFEAAMYFDLHRMPELFCGFARDPGEGPVLYPMACAPQSWSAASVFLFLQAALGLQIDGVRGRVSLVRPALPPFLNDIEITNLRVGASILDFHLARHGDDVSARVLRREGDLEILISQ
jgi:glycogen debranching enzyme